MKTVNIIQCPYCKTLIDPWEFLDTGDMEGEFTMNCENEECGKEFSVKFATDVKFTSEALDSDN